MADLRVRKMRELFRVREDLHILRKSSVASPVQARTGSRELIPCVIASRSAIHGRRESSKIPELGVREDLHILCKSSVASPVQARTGSRESISCVIDSRKPKRACPGLRRGRCTEAADCHGP